jgi:hypothetical protein
MKNANAWRQYYTIRRAIQDAQILTTHGKLITSVDFNAVKVTEKGSFITAVLKGSKEPVLVELSEIEIK